MDPHIIQPSAITSASAQDSARQAPVEVTAAPVPRSGGPRTRAGKQCARRNALRHGLTATKLLPEVLPPGRIGELRATLRDQLAPGSAIEEILVAELARHAAMLELGERAELSVLRRGAVELAEYHSETSSQADQTDAFLAAAVTSDAIDRFARYRRGHEKAFTSSLKALLEFSSRRNARPATRPTAERKNWDEQACEAWLRERAARGPWRCPHCGPATANWLAGRKALQCKQCRRQTGLRSGTVMAGSPLALAAWFRAIEAVAANPNISAADVSRLVVIGRAATAQRMLTKIRDALASDDRELLLAGLVPASNPRLSQAYGN